MSRSTWLGVLCVAALLAIAGGGVPMPRAGGWCGLARLTRTSARPGTIDRVIVPGDPVASAPAIAPAPVAGTVAHVTAPATAGAPVAPASGAWVGPPAPADAVVPESWWGPPVPDAAALVCDAGLGPPAPDDGTRDDDWIGPPIPDELDPVTDADLAAAERAHDAPARTAGRAWPLPTESAILAPTGFASAEATRLAPRRAPRHGSRQVAPAIALGRALDPARLASRATATTAAGVTGSGALACACVALTMTHGRNRRERVSRAYARGRSVAAIARRTRLAQDGVRTLLHASAQAPAPVRQLLPVGRIVRRRADRCDRLQWSPDAITGTSYESAASPPTGGTTLA